MDVTLTWAISLNNNALSQHYGGGSFNYAVTESVSSGFFTSTVSTTDITDWILLELHDAAAPATIIQRRAAFVREDGRIVDLDGTSDVAFRDLPTANYFIVIRHRNHLSIRSSATQLVNSALSS